MSKGNVFWSFQTKTRLLAEDYIDHMIHTFLIRRADRDIFEAIRRGRKTIETRAATRAKLRIVTGDTIRFVCGSRTTRRKVFRVQRFRSIGALLKAVSLRKVFVNGETVADTRRAYKRWYGHKMAKVGVIAFTLKTTSRG